MRYADRKEREAIADLVCSIRPHWQRWMVLAILQAHAQTIDLTDLAIGAVRTASDERMPTPKAIGWNSRHWRDLDTAPMIASKARERCRVCGKPEERCWTERPGPDDHLYDPAPHPAQRAAGR